MNKNKIQILFNKKFIIFWIILISTIFSFLFFTTSPLYSFNTWDDVAVYERVGHGWLSNGAIPYKTLFDHKGPLHYLLFGIGTILKIHSQYVGVFLLEIVLMTITIYNYYRSALVFVKSKKVALMLITIIQLFLFVTYDFYTQINGVQHNINIFDMGGTPEQFCMPFISYIIYLMLKVFNQEKICLSNREWLLYGMSLVCIFLEKFTIAIPFSLLTIVIFSYLAKKDRSELFKAAKYCIGVILSTLLIVTLYFKLNGALSDFITYYFKVNIFNYSGEKRTILLKLIDSVLVGFELIISNPIFLISICGSVVGITFSRKMETSHKVILLSTYSLMFVLGMISGRNYVHYLLPILPFTVIGIILLWNDNWNIYIKKGYFVKISLSLIFVSLVTFGLSHYQVYYSKVGNRETPTSMQIMANLIKKDPKFDKEKTNILPIYTGHVMLYNLTDTTPKVRFFYKPVMELNQYNKEIMHNIKTKKADYIYTRLPNTLDIKSKHWINKITNMILKKDVRKKIRKYLKNYKLVYYYRSNHEYDWTTEYLLKRK